MVAQGAARLEARKPWERSAQHGRVPAGGRQKRRAGPVAPCGGSASLRLPTHGLPASGGLAPWATVFRLPFGRLYLKVATEQTDNCQLRRIAPRPRLRVEWPPPGPESVIREDRPMAMRRVRGILLLVVLRGGGRRRHLVLAHPRRDQARHLPRSLRQRGHPRGGRGVQGQRARRLHARHRGRRRSRRGNRWPRSTSAAWSLSSRRLRRSCRRRRRWSPAWRPAAARRRSTRRARTWPPPRPSCRRKHRWSRAWKRAAGPRRSTRCGPTWPPPRPRPTTHRSPTGARPAWPRRAWLPPRPSTTRRPPATPPRPR